MKKRKSPVKRTRPSRKSSHHYRPLVIGLLALSAVVYFAISRLPKATPIDINEVTSIPATVTLSLPSTVASAPGSESSVDITINTGGAKVTAVQVELTYDPAGISSPTIVQGDFLTDKLGTPKAKDGVISFVYTVPVQSQDGKSGEGKLATLRFKAKNANSQISFTSKTMVAAIGGNSNVLASATGTNVVLSSTINDPQSTISTAPPVLTDIAPAPALTSPSTIYDPQSTTPTTYLPENDYDYSQAGLESPTGVPSTPTSLFARFLATIKALFTSKP